ncbi:MarC family protein [Aeromicrobium sp.]|uniref:MarC family protein n=1 Tax=Aeromicrobium sp. TaxID=1871063 RepID=UPI003D6BC195
MNGVVNGTLLAEVFVTLFVIMDPPGTIPLFLALTSKETPRQRNRQAWQAVAVAFLVIVSFALFGRQLLTYLHISLPALQCAGGLLLLLVALELLTGKEETPSETKDVNVALVPLGTPLLAGPGAIVATMVFVERVDDWPTFAAVALGVIGVHLTLWLFMRYSVVVLRVIKESGVTLVTRISGLLLSAIAVQLVADSIRAFIAGEG